MKFHLGQSIQEFTKQNLWKTAFKKFEVIWPAFTNFTWSILEYLDLYYTFAFQNHSDRGRKL